LIRTTPHIVLDRENGIYKICILFVRQELRSYSQPIDC
jgi:hypothetical protein